MEELLIAAAVLAAVLYFGSSGAPSVLTQTPAAMPPTSTLVAPDSGSVSGGYQLTAQATNLASQAGYRDWSISPVRTFIAPPPVPQAAPYVSGGIAGTAFSGGNPYGSALRPGISAGTGTTIIPTVFRPVAL